MDSPSSQVRRQTWIQSSRDSWHTQNDLDLPRPQCDPSSTLHSSTARSFNSIFSDGCSDGKIESWLRGCGMETGSEGSVGLNAGMFKVHICQSSQVRLCDGLNKVLLLVNVLNHVDINNTPRQKPPSLNLGNSMASSCPSFSTIKTVSSVSEVLQSCLEDAEETLFQLGFGQDVPQPPARVPIRFFTFPSQLQGINFRLFLQSQLQRIREEDPNLSIASRFRQVEALTAMANAFYSLYSHVSRTPLPKLTPLEPNLSLSPVEKLDRFRAIGGGVRSEPRSPVERLKDTVSKMCLYTGGTWRDSDSASPLASPRKHPSLPEVVGIVLENAKFRAPKKLDFLEQSLDVRPRKDKEEEETYMQQTTGSNVPKQKKGTTGCHKGVGTGEQSDMVESDWNGVESSDLDKSRTVNFVSMWPSFLASPVSGETESQRNSPMSISNELARNRGAPERLVCDVTDNSTHGIRVSHDVLFPAIAKNSHHQALFCSPTDYGDANHLPQVLSGSKISPLRTCLGPDRTNKTCEPLPSRSRGVSMETSNAEKDCRLDSADPCLDKYAREAGPTLTHHLVPRSIHPPCCITVTGWEEDNVTSLVTQGPNHPGPKQALSTGTRQLLSPLKHPKLKHISNKLNQANSFEMEEVSSAGEEDFGQSESTQITITKRQCKAAVVRGDSMQSDSSGYAEEEVGFSSERHGS
ncbi:unnamed protein product [Lota lota]